MSLRSQEIELGDFGFFVSRKWGLRSIRIHSMAFEDAFDYLGAGLDLACDPDLGLFRCKKSVFLFLPEKLLCSDSGFPLVQC